MEFRNMTSKDIYLIKELELEMRRQEVDVFNEFNGETFKENFKSRKIEDLDNYETILCIDSNKVIARIDLMFEQSFMDFKKVGYVDWVYVLKPHRNKGIAKKLFEEAITYFKNRDCVLYYLFVAENEEAIAFYNSIDIDIKTIKRASKIV